MRTAGGPGLSRAALTPWRKPDMAETHKADMSSMLNSALSGGWEAARDALIPAAEGAAGAAGKWLANNGPDFVTERIVPRFIESFNEASGGS
jgi:hypothetical protein